MKSRFTTIDLRCVLSELGDRLMGMRVLNVYDVDNKTYLIRLAKPDQKEVLLFESGNRIHSTTFEWPKNMMPSSFSMKLRKHLKTRRLVQIKQLGMDRIVDLQFGSDEAAYHLIVELYDRGNVILTDFEFNILSLLRTRKEGDDVRFAVREKYPIETVKTPQPLMEVGRLQDLLSGAKSGEVLKRVLNPNFVYGPALIDHCLRGQGFTDNVKIGQGFNVNEDLPRLMEALKEAEQMMHSGGTVKQKGYIIQKIEKKPASSEGQDSSIVTYSEYHPFLYRQHEQLSYLEFDTFDQAVDDFYSKIGSQKLDMKVLQQERAAFKKLDNVKKDHDKRIAQLQTNQETDKRKAELIEVNLTLVDKAIQIVRSAIANQIDWTEIKGIINEAQIQGDPVAMAIKNIKLDTNHITMSLRDPFEIIEDDEDEDKEKKEDKKSENSKPMKIDVDLGLSAYANARKYFDLKKHSKMKETRTLESSSKAIKSAERKTKKALKEVATVTSIKKARKTYWFEKFYWFISSENFLVIAGRDQQQNELVVKKYLNTGDIYVHADLHGASSVIIKNTTGQPVPPKTLQEAGVMAICYSVAWEARVVTSAWWVKHDQVSKTAPTGEYLTTGSFMVRGKKNYLPPTHLLMGFGIMFKVDESSVFRHKNERKIRCAEDEESIATESTADEEELKLPSDIEDDDDVKSKEDEDENVEEEKMNDKEEDHTDNMEQLKEESSESDGESLFPDTSIQVQHIQGEKYELQRTRGSSVLSTSSQHSTGVDDEDDDENNVIYLGDNQPIVLGKKLTEEEQKTKQRLSAKQRRDLKKKPSQKDTAVEDVEDVQPESIKVEQTNKKKAQKQVQQQEPVKRGQKAKQKKMKAKYQDQDEEERKLKMELLASAGAPKEVKGKKAKKKLQQQQKYQQQKQNYQKQREKEDIIQEPEGDEPSKAVPEEIQTLEKEEEDVVKPFVATHTWKKDAKDEVEDDDEDDEEKESIQASGSILDSVTGQPHAEDLLLFALPVCAPYSVMQNFKFKVKLTPGTGKRGKAAKTAMHMFQSSKESTPREKDLFRSIKDTDLSRNIPGKVKVSAPNLHKHKR